MLHSRKICAIFSKSTSMDVWKSISFLFKIYSLSFSLHGRCRIDIWKYGIDIWYRYIIPKDVIYCMQRVKFPGGSQHGAEFYIESVSFALSISLIFMKIHIFFFESTVLSHFAISCQEKFLKRYSSSIIIQHGAPSQVE